MERILMGLFSRAQDEPVDESEAWTVRYTAEILGGGKFSWERTATFQPDDRFVAAGNWLLAERTAQHGLVSEGVFYPPHRIKRITWQILS